jgi:hypothetical protein
MQRFSIICAALILASIPCLAQDKAKKQEAEDRKGNAALQANIERRRAIIRDYLDTDDRCLDEVARNVDTGVCDVSKEKFERITLADLGVFIDRYTVNKLTLKPLNDDEIRQLKLAILFNISDGYRYGQRKALQR